MIGKPASVVEEVRVTTASICLSRHLSRGAPLALATVALLLRAATPSIAAPTLVDLGVGIPAISPVQTGDNIKIKVNYTNKSASAFPVNAAGDSSFIVYGLKSDFQVTGVKWLMPTPITCQVKTHKKLTGAACPAPNVATEWKPGETRVIEVDATIKAPAPSGANATIKFCGEFFAGIGLPWGDGLLDDNDKKASRNKHCRSIELLAPIDTTQYDLGITKEGPAEVVPNSPVEFTIYVFNRHTAPLAKDTNLHVHDTWALANKLTLVSAQWGPKSDIDGACVQSASEFSCTGKLGKILMPGEKVAIKATFTAGNTGKVENCAELKDIPGDLSDADNKRNKHCTTVAIKPDPLAKHDLSVKVEMADLDLVNGKPKWDLASKQKVRVTVQANTAQPYSLPVGKTVNVTATMTDGLRVGDVSKPHSQTFTGSGGLNWLCSWGGWDSAKPTPTVVNCMSTSTVKPGFQSSSFDIPVWPGINKTTQSGWKQESAEAEVQLDGAPDDNTSNSTAKAAPVSIWGIAFDLKKTAGNGQKYGTWDVGTEQKFDIFFSIGDRLVNKEWFVAGTKYRIVDVLSKKLQYLGYSSTSGNWTCAPLATVPAPPPGGTIECIYSPNGTGQISYPKFGETVSLHVKLLEPGTVDNVVTCAESPMIKLPGFNEPFSVASCTSGGATINGP